MHPQAPTTAATTPDSAPAPDAVRAMLDRQLVVLSELMEFGLGLAQAIKAQVTEPGAPIVVRGDVALAFDRVTRAVRMTIALQARLIQEMQRPVADRTGAAPAAHAAPSAEAGVPPAECDPKETAEAAEAVEREAAERLADPSEFDAVMRRPVNEIVALIRRDLGLPPDGPGPAGAAWPRAALAGGRVGAPLRTLSPSMGARAGRGGGSGSASSGFARQGATAIPESSPKRRERGFRAASP